MCVFITFEEVCLLQKLNQFHYTFSDDSIEKALEESVAAKERSRVPVLSPEQRMEKYSCYRAWPDRFDWVDYIISNPDHIDIPTDDECFISGEFALEGNPDERYYEEISAYMLDGYIRRDCPRIEGSRICQVIGFEYPETSCPMIKDLNNGKISLDNNYFSIFTEVIAKKELAYLFRLLSKREIPCDIIKEIIDNLTEKQAALIWLRSLPKAVNNAEIEYITGMKKHNFHNIIYGTTRPNGRKTGGVAQKIGKIMRKNTLDDNLIKWFCMKVFKLARFDPDTTNIALGGVPTDGLRFLGFRVHEGDDGELEYDLRIIPWWWWEREEKAEQGYVDIE